jgi:hypothetical protein
MRVCSYENTRIQLSDQKWALSGEATFYWWPKTEIGKTNIFLFSRSIYATIARVVISPLMAIEQGQALDLQRLFGRTCPPLVVVDGT